MKNLFKIFIQSMLFFVFIMLSNCSKDEFTNQIKNSKSKTDITLEQFKKETGLNNFKTTISIPKNINVIAKNADGTYELSDFNISTDKIKKVIINEKTTYTFQIETIDEKYGDRFFNLTLFYKDGWQSIIVELKPTTENLEQLKLGITEKFEGTLKLLYKSELTQNNMLGCTTVFITNWHCTGCTGPCDWCSLCVSSESYTMCGSEPVAAEPFFLDLGPSTIGGGPSDGTNTDTTNINSTTTNDEIAIETNISPNTITNNDGSSDEDFLTENDDDYENIDYTGPKQLIPQQIVLSNGSIVNVTFGTTESDNQNANNEVAVDLVNSIIFALEQANSNLSNSEKINSIYIKATTNGNHSSNSNHSKGTAVDISRINGIMILNLATNSQVVALQNAFDEYQNIRENFGPYFKHKTFLNGSVNLNYPVIGHNDHIHISVQSN